MDMISSMEMREGVNKRSGAGICLDGSSRRVAVAPKWLPPWLALSRSWPAPDHHVRRARTGRCCIARRVALDEASGTYARRLSWIAPGCLDGRGQIKTSERRARSKASKAEGDEGEGAG